MKKNIWSTIPIIALICMILPISCDKAECQYEQPITPVKSLINGFELSFNIDSKQCHVSGTIGSENYVWTIIDGSSSYSFDKVFVDETPIKCIAQNDNSVTILYGSQEGSEMFFTMDNISIRGDTLLYDLSLGDYGSQSFKFVSTSSIVNSVLTELFQDTPLLARAAPTYTYIYQLIHLSAKETICIVDVQQQPYIPETWESTYLCYMNNPSFLTPCEQGQTRVEHHCSGHHGCWTSCQPKTSVL